MSSVFSLRMDRSSDGVEIVCAGELDVSGAAKLKDAVDLALIDRPSVLKLDVREVSLLSSAGIKAFLGALELCRAAGVLFNLQVQGHPRRVLDLVGLWWLGVIDDGGEIQAILQEAMSRYGELYDDHGLGGGLRGGEVVE